jgi:hypothetical protein
MLAFGYAQATGSGLSPVVAGIDPGAAGDRTERLGR